MQKKTMWAVLGTLLAVMVASVALILTVGPRTSADSEQTIGTLNKEEYFEISDGVLTGLSEIGYNFLHQYDLIDVVIPEGVVEIGSQDWYKSIFYNNDNDYSYNHKIASVKLPNTLEIIGAHSFACIGSPFAWLEIPSSVKTIQEHAFDSCYDLDVFIPKNVEEIGECAFADCGILYCEADSKPDGWDYSWYIDLNSDYPSDYLWNCGIDDEYIYQLDDSNVYKIEKYVGNSLIVAVPNTFNGQVVKIIDDYAFSSSGITSVIIPDSVTTIGYAAFDYCSSLTTIYCEAESQPDSWSWYWKGNSNASVVWNYVPSYTIIFNVNGGNAVGNQTIEHNGYIVEPTAPTKDGYTFAGWYSDEALTSAYNFDTAVTNDLTLYAKWELKTYTVTFNSNSGSAVDSATVNHGATVTEPAEPVRENYNFVYWYSENENEAYDFETAVTEDLTLYAKWKINTYTVTFNTNCDITMGNRTVDYGDTVNEPTITRDGYTFGGWYTDEALTNAYDFDTAVTSDLTLYAKWEAILEPEPEPEEPVVDEPSESETPVDNTDNTVDEENSAVVNADKNNMAGVIAGVSVGAAVLIAAGVTVGVVLAKKRRQ